MADHKLGFKKAWMYIKDYKEQSKTFLRLEMIILIDFFVSVIVTEDALPHQSSSHTKKKEQTLSKKDIFKGVKSIVQVQKKLDKWLIPFVFFFSSQESIVSLWIIKEIVFRQIKGN